MEKSSLSHYIQSLRLRRGYSTEFVASRARIELSDYLRYEKSPETARASYHPRILSILCTDSYDYLDFQIMAGLIHPMCASKQTIQPLKFPYPDSEV